MPTDEELEDARDRLQEQLEKGIQSSAKEDMRLENYDPVKQLDVIERLERKNSNAAAAARPNFGLRFTKLIPPGGG